MNHKAVLVISNKWDAHADAFIKAMNDRGNPIVRINTEDFRANNINISVDNQSDLSWHIITPEKRIISDSAVSGVYIRRMSMPIDVTSINDQFQEFARKETHVILDAIGTLLEGKRWLNEPCIREQASNKVRQFMSRLGIKFGVIDMIVTDGGDYVFLEINPDGNWLCLPSDIHPLITEAVASYFS